MLSTGSNRFERWQGNSDIIAFAFLFDAIICRIKIHFLVIMTSSDSVSSGVTTAPATPAMQVGGTLGGRHITKLTVF